MAAEEEDEVHTIVNHPTGLSTFLLVTVWVREEEVSHVHVAQAEDPKAAVTFDESAQAHGFFDVGFRAGL